MADNVMQKTAFHIIDGPTVMYAADAHQAVGRFPLEWAWVPWAPEESDAARRAKRDREIAVAKAEGRAPPPAEAELEPLTDAQKKELADDAARRAEAAERLRAKAEADEKQRKIDEQVAADKALVSSPPPQPDRQPKRPFGRSGPLTPGEQAAADKKAAAKADADQLSEAPVTNVGADGVAQASTQSSPKAR